MSSWLNFVAIAAPRNGTTTHTVDPSSATGVVQGTPFTPTAGRALLVVAAGAVTSTTPSGWTLPTNGSAINNAGLYRWHKASASGGDTISTTHNASNYPVQFAFFEFPAGTTFGACVSATGANWTAANPTLSGLTGTNTVMGAASEGNTSTSSVISATWGSPNVEAVDANALKVGTTDGCWLGVAYQDAYASATYAPVPTITNVGNTTTERLTFAVNPPASGTDATVTSPPVDGTGDMPNPTINAGSIVVPSVADGAGDVSDPTLVASSNVTSPVIDGTGDVSDPADVSGTATLPDHFDSPDGTLGSAWIADPLSVGATELTKIGGEASGANGTNFQSYWNADTFVTTGSGMRVRVVFKHRPATNVGQSAYIGFVDDPGGTPVGYAGLIGFGSSVDSFSVGAWLHASLDGPHSLGRLLTSGDVIDLYVMADGTIAAVVNDVIVSQAVDTTYFNAGETGYATLGFNDTTGSSQSLVAFDDFDATSGVAIPSSIVLAPPVDGTGASPAPNIAAGANVTAAPAGGIGDTPNPTISADSTVASAVADGVGTTPSPTPSAGSTITSPAADAAGTSPAAVISAGSAVTTTPLSGTGALPFVSAIADAALGIGPLVGVGSSPASIVTGTSAGGVAASPLDGSGDIPTPLIGADSTISPGPSDGVGDVSGPTIDADSTIVPGALDGAGSAPSPVVSAGTTISAAPGQGAGAMLRPVVTSTGRVMPRIDLPTRVILDPMITILSLADHPSTMIVDPIITAYVIRDLASTSTLDPQPSSIHLIWPDTTYTLNPASSTIDLDRQADSVEVDGQPSLVLIDA